MPYAAYKIIYVMLDCVAVRRCINEQMGVNDIPEWRRAMAYGIYYERCENMSLKKYEKLKFSLLKRNDCHVEFPVHTRKITYQNPNDRKTEDKVVYRIVMKNKDAHHLHLTAEMKTEGQVCRKAVWLLKEDCIRILDGDIEWMKEMEDAVFYDFYYQIRYGGYRPIEVTEVTSHFYYFPKQNYTVILETSKKKSDQPAEQFFSDNWSGEEQQKTGRVRAIYRREQILPKQTEEFLNITNELELQYV